MPGAQFWEVRSLPAIFAAVNVEQKRLKQHGFPTLYRREGQHVLCIDPTCQARHRGWMWDGDGVSLGSADWKRPPEAGTQSWLWDSLSGTQAGA